MLTAERYAQGYDFAAYVAKMGDDGHKFASRYDKFAVDPEDANVFAGLTGPVHILVLSENWCPDCVNNVPVIARIADLNPKLDLKVFPRDANLDVMDLFLTDGKRTIPTVVFFDGEFNEIGRWIERPAVVKEGLKAGSDAEKMELKKEYIQGKYLHDVVKEVRAILTR